MMREFWISAVAVALLCGCSHNSDSRLREYVFDQAGDNRAELESLLSRYDDSRRELAEYTLEAVAGQTVMSSRGIDSVEAIYSRVSARGESLLDADELERAQTFAAMPLSKMTDAAVLSADYLASNIDDTWRLWRSRPWNSELTTEQVAELLLPYRIGNEPLTAWREPYRMWLDSLETAIAGLENSVDAARIVAEHIGAVAYNDQLSTPHRSALRLLDVPLGYCRDDCDRTLYAMRSMGIPVAVDIMPVSPDNGGSHQWNVVYDNELRRYRMFDNQRFLPTRDSLHNDLRRKGKVFRNLFRPDFSRADRFRDVANAPAWMLNPRLKDVTAEYFGFNRAEVEVGDEPGDVYLGLFTSGIYRPIDIAERSGSKAVFTDIEPRIIYFPIVRERSGDYRPCSLPFMLCDDGTVRVFAPDTTRMTSARLTRKFPIRFYQRERLASVVGLQVQVANSHGGPWRTIHTIETPPRGNYYRIPGGNIAERFIRLYKPSGSIVNLSELLAARDSLGLVTMPLEIAGPDSAGYKYRFLADGNIMTGNPLAAADGDLIFHNPAAETIPNLFLVPSNDDNFVVPDQVYELFYFSPSGWKSLGRKTADDFAIDFPVPTNAVLWLRNLTKGREEQPFIYSSRQLFNIDL